MSYASSVKRELKRMALMGNYDNFLSIFEKAQKGEWGHLMIYNKKSNKKVIKVELSKKDHPLMVRVFYEDRNSQMLFKNFFNNIEIKEWDKWDHIEDEDEDEFDPDFWDRMGVVLERR